MNMVFKFIAIYPKFDVKLLKIDRWRDANGITVFIAELAMIIYTIYFIVTEARELKKQKLEYFKVWNFSYTNKWALFFIFIDIGISVTKYQETAKLSVRFAD